MTRAVVARPAVLAFVAWIAASVAIATTGWMTRAYRDFDFFPMWLAGRELLRGTDIYDPAAWSALFASEGSAAYPLIPGTGFGYPLPAALLMVPLGALPFALAAALWAAGVLVLAATGTLALGRALFAPRHRRRDLVLLFGLMASAQPLWVTMVTGQVSGLLIGIVAHATALLARDRAGAAGVALAPLGVKAHLFLWAVPALLLASEARTRIARGAAAGGGVLLAASFLVRADWPAAWLRTVERAQASNVSRANAFGVAPDDARWLGWSLVALVAAAFALWWRTRPPAHAVWAGALALSLFATPYSWSYDHGALVVPAAVIIAVVADRPASVRVPFVSAVALAWVVLPWILYLDAHRTGTELAAAVVPALVLALLIAADRARRSEDPRVG